jgi:Tol biopolymer transport system component
MKCPRCGNKNPPGALKCTACGKPLPRDRRPAQRRRRILLAAIGGGLALVAIIIVVVVLLAGKRLGPQRSQQRIAWINSNGDVETVYDNGSDPRILTSAEGKVSYTLPRWSPDHRWLVAISLDQETRQYSLWLAGATDTVGRLVPLGIKAIPLAEWSPDSQQVALSGTDGSGAWQLVLANVQGESHAIPLGMVAQQIAWSPDGQHIAMIGQVGDAASGSSHILIADVAQGQVRSVAQGTTEKFWTVDWMPDGQRFLATQADAMGGSAVLYSFRADGSDQQPMDLPGKEGTTGWPLYSPDGDRLAYEAVDATTGVWSLFATRADGSEAREVATSQDHVYPTEWSPDGSYLLYYERGKTTLWVYDARSGQSLALPGDADYHYTGCVFGPDVPALACASEEKIVFLVYLDEGRILALAHGDSPDW